MMDDTRRQFFLHANGSVEAMTDVVVCGQTAIIHASVNVVERAVNDGDGYRIIREPALSDAIKKANALLDEKLEALKTALGEAV